MLGRLNHVAIATPDLQKAMATYRDILGAQVGEVVDLPEHGVSTVFIHLPNTHVELLHPLGENSPIAGFLARNPAGGIHHMCYEVTNIEEAVEILHNRGVRVLDAKPRIGAHGKLVVFLHPKDMGGVLIELEEA
ncbi:MAG: methylmalonyl-CoA epimerase [Magnetococcales bacterium]|nr:methylmalonyl-CoA epimerase [Magnetococcales bacterium]NGZ27555.1 methylmalonyl-CoA epimerase [Magnetococcales bacterium]